MTRLRFLMTTTFYPPYHVGGDAVHVNQLVEELGAWGHEVHVMYSVDAFELKRGATSGPSATAEGAAPKGVHLHPLKSRRGGFEVLAAYLRGRSAFFSGEFERLLDEVSPDVVHHHNVSLLGYDLLRQRGRYVNLYTAHDYWLVCQKSDLLRNGNLCDGKRSCLSCVLRSRRPPQIWRGRRAFRRALGDIDVVIAPSDYVGRTIGAATGLTVATIPNFVAPPPEAIPPSGLDNYFLYVGVLETHKGVDHLVRLFGEQWREIGAGLVIAGTGSLEKYLRDYVRRNGLDDVIRVLGWYDHTSLYSLYRDAHALVMPSVWPENAPLAVLEALSVGTPVVTSAMGGLPELAGLQGEGFVSGLSGLKETLTRVRRGAPDPERLREIHRSHFSPERFMSRYLELIEEKRGDSQE